MGGVAGGHYAAIKRGPNWVVRAPDGRIVETFGPSDSDHKKARQAATRLTQKLRAIDQK